MRIMAKDQMMTIKIAGDENKINNSTDDFRIIREENSCYIDKSRMIEDILNYDHRRVVLFTRPRRFGKSLNLSMLRYFFDLAEDSRALFHDLYIENSLVFAENLNQYPVVYLNFKNSNVETKENAVRTIGNMVHNIFNDLARKYNCPELLSLEFVLNSGEIDAEQLKQMTKLLKEKQEKM